MNLCLGVVILALAIASTPDALAQTVMLRCDPTNPAGGSPLVITIDTSQDTVHEGEDPGTGWAYDRDMFIDETDPPSRPESNPGAGDGYTHCSYKATQFVRITKGSVEYGANETQLKPCGLDSKKLASHLVLTHSLDRFTGVLSYTEQDTIDGFAFPPNAALTWQCKVMNGPLF